MFSKPKKDIINTFPVNIFWSRVGLAQLIRFLVVELIHTDSNTKFDMSVIFMTNYSFSGRRVLRRQRDDLSDRLCEF
jgi:hypothetical protein